MQLAQFQLLQGPSFLYFQDNSVYKDLLKSFSWLFII